MAPENAPPHVPPADCCCAAKLITGKATPLPPHCYSVSLHLSHLRQLYDLSRSCTQRHGTYNAAARHLLGT